MPLSRHWLKSAALACCWLASVLSLHAQGTGTIQGRVFNPVSKEYVRNAEVRLESVQQVVFTENDGSFQFLNVPAGAAKITVTFTGYNTIDDTFTVVAGQTAVRELNLTSTAAAPTTKDGVVQLSAFTVASEREGNAKAIQAQRAAMNITTSVSSDLFGDVTAGNVGEFLKYLPGVDLDYVEPEARGPRLGGMDGQYVGISLDGMRTANADANRGGGASSRATSFEGFSITAVESIEINWTSTPANDADTPAGNINMRTKRAFDRKGRQVSYNFSTTFNSEEFTLKKTDGQRGGPDRKFGPNYQLVYAESFFNQKFGVLASVSHSYLYNEQMLLSNTYSGNASTDPVNPRPWVTRVIDFKDGPRWDTKDAMLLTADWKITPRLVLSLNMMYTMASFEFWNRNFTFNAANDNNNIANGRPTIRGDGITTVAVDRDATNTFANLTNGGGTSDKTTQSRQYAPKFEYRHGPLIVDGGLAFSKSRNNYESLERGFSNNEGGSAIGGFTATRPSAKSWEWTMRQTSGADWFDLRSFNSTDARSGGTRVTNDDRTWITEKWTGTLNARYAPRASIFERFPTIFSVGSKWDEETRDNNHHSDTNIWAYTGPGGNTTTVNPTTGANQNVTFGHWLNLGPQFQSTNRFELGRTNAFTMYNINGQEGMAPRVSRSHMSDLYHARPDLFTYMGTPENYYSNYIANKRDFRQVVSAGYGQADVKLTAKLRTLFGVRYEETRTRVKTWDPRTRAEVIAAGYAVNAPATNGGRALTLDGIKYQFESQPKKLVHANYHNWFPSVNVKYQILRNFDWQVGWNKSIGRAPIDNLAGVTVIDENALRVSIPNTTLLPEFHNKYQTRLAYYFSGRSPGSLTLGLSKTTFRNLIQSYDYTAAEWGNDDPDLANFTFRSTRNLSDRVTTTKNLTAAYRQTLGFLPSEYLRGVGVFLNYDRTYVGQSGDGSGAAARRSNLTPHRVAGGVSYFYRRFNGSLNFVWGDDRPESGTYGRYYSQITKVDCTLSWKLHNYATLYVQGRNIRNAPDIWYQSPPGTPEGKNGHLRAMESYGALWTFGVRGTF
jgi:iron complex outermembrane receptor protein